MFDWCFLHILLSIVSPLLSLMASSSPLLGPLHLRIFLIIKDDRYSCRKIEDCWVDWKRLYFLLETSIWWLIWICLKTAPSKRFFFILSPSSAGIRSISSLVPAKASWFPVWPVSIDRRAIKHVVVISRYPSAMVFLLWAGGPKSVCFVRAFVFFLSFKLWV